MKQFIKLIALALFSNTLLSFPARSEILSASQILLSLPVCQLNTSYGQLCKTFDKKGRLSFRLSMLQDITTKDLGTAEAFIETEDWYNSIDNIEKTSNGFTFYFTDDAKQGTYLTQEKFFVEKQNSTGIWQIIGSEVTYISDGQQNEVGKFYLYSNPIDIK